ncbi:hypothetical protein P4V33_25500, partial [Brevibacillus borstelensis]|uniref:hypothetical protein n=1 Tax=Brevibacillus borstelensis TaxID=45462 RepID=UPI002E1C6396|nr:hypothetical protein [Brevibacillus borstelensis]
ILQSVKFNQPVTGEVNPSWVEETREGENPPITGVNHLINQSINQNINQLIDDDDLAGGIECGSSNLNNKLTTQDTNNPFSKMEKSLLSDNEFPFEKYAERLFDGVESDGELHFVDIDDLKEESETSLRKTLAGLCHRLLQDESETEEYLDNINSLDRKKLLKGIECFQLFFENEIEAESAYAICKRFTTEPQVTWVKNLIGGYQYHIYKKPIQKQKNREFYSKGNGKSTKQSSSPGGSAQKKQSVVTTVPKKGDIEPPDFKSIDEQMQGSEEGCPF